MENLLTFRRRLWIVVALSCEQKSQWALWALSMVLLLAVQWHMLLKIYSHFFSLFICFPAFSSNHISHKWLIIILLLFNYERSAVHSLLGFSFPDTLFVFFFFAVEQEDKHSGSSSHLSLEKSMHKVNSKYSSEKMLWLSKELAILNSKL